MLSGKVPFPGNSELEIIGNVIKGDFHFNHEPFQRHSAEAKEFLQCLIKKDVNERLTAEQALAHSWIQNSQMHDKEPMSGQVMEDFQETYNILRQRKAILLYLSQTCKPNNYIRLSEAMKAGDKDASGFISVDQFQQSLQAANMSAIGKEFDIVVKELQEVNAQNDDRIQYQYFLDAVYLTQMYINEMELYQALKAADKDGQNGVTITEVKDILKTNPAFQFPEEALGAAFKAMLGADINSIEPDCIIDTDKFIASLHKEFEAISERSLSQIK